ncbi:phage tail protein [Azospirillum sp. Sh1]|uniref:phage tail protein n=1 Tax=Azospirillum sp. Sh1 TaxID=2607285 RepID=UPI0011F00517|nr:phage tail protein [Azospirillum sp. Sh1]KAA0573367.1 phage tail protein [Azospirillum sp. Sh1]
MTVPTFVPPYPPVLGSEIEPEFKVLEAGFGDGYTQRAADGLNNIRDQLTVTWERLTSTELSVIEDFIRARRGTESFWWQPPGDHYPRRWICRKLKRTRASNNGINLNATFIEVFDA